MMNKTWRHVSFFLLLLLLTAFQPAEELSGRVVGVLDGDTIDVLRSDNTSVRIRFNGIDAPEKDQPYGQKSKAHLSGLVFNQTVRVEYSSTDRYGRILGDVFVGETKTALWVNKEMIDAGLAWHYKQYNSDDRLALAEDAARQAKRGLWAGPGPIAPWEWRRNKR